MTGLGDLGPLFEQHKAAILGTAAVGVAGLALYRRKTGSTTAAGAAPAVQSASAGGQVAGMSGGAGYDSSASDLYGAIEPQLEALSQQFHKIPVTTPPVASQITAPTGTGKYVVLPGNLHAEVESDGSLFHITGDMQSQLIKSNGGKPINYQAMGVPLSWYEASQNMQAKQNGAAAVTFTKTGTKNSSIQASDQKTRWVQ